jgi:hypothetical protein
VGVGVVLLSLKAALNSETMYLKSPFFFVLGSFQVTESGWQLTSHFHVVPNSSGFDLIKIAGNFS